MAEFEECVMAWFSYLLVFTAVIQMQEPEDKSEAVSLHDLVFIILW